MASIHEITKVCHDKPTGLWGVWLLSHVTGSWILVGEHRTEEAADADRKNWL